MAITLVSDGGVAGSSGATPLTVSKVASVGHTVTIAGLVFNGATSLAGITSITDNTAGSNTWNYSTSNSNSPPSQVFTGGGNFICCFVAWSILAAPITSVTIAAGTGSPFWRLAVEEWAGIVAAGSGAASTGTSAAPSTSVNLNNSGDLVLGATDVNTATYTGTPAGFTASTGAGTVDNIGYMTPGAAGNFTATWALSASDVWGNVLQTFSPVPVVLGSPGINEILLAEAF